jgi:CheY-like chemotaxis protein
MDLTNPLGQKSVTTETSRDKDVKLRCELSKALEDAGDYERACDALGDMWRRIDERPNILGLERPVAAEVLMRAGALTGWIGNKRQLEGAQERAKNLISEAETLFESVDDESKVAEAQTELAYCYWREGAFDEARVVLKDALRRLSTSDNELRARALIRLSIVERTANHYDLALEILDEAAPLVAASTSDALKGRFHNQRATTLENLARAEGRPEKIDQALIEYAASGFHLEQAGHMRNYGLLENNLGFLFYTIGRYDEAHEHLARARATFAKIKDVGGRAEVDETRARVLLAEGRLDEAEISAQDAARSFEASGQQSQLAEALTTLGIVQARAGHHAEASESLQRAVETAEHGGDPEGAGVAAVSIIEELGEQMSAREICGVFEHASALLSNSRNPGTLTRLNACARRAIAGLSNLHAAHDNASPVSVEEKWKGFSLKREVIRYEAEVIERALRDASGVVSHASKLLGFKHHQTFVALLNNRHKSLLHARNPIRPRRRCTVRVRGPRRAATHRADRETRPITILFVEDNRVVADAIRDTLEFEGWRVEACLDGATALGKVESPEHFDLILLDQDLPGVSGLELTERARALTHRHNTPIIIISATNCQTAAREAGANAFLKKPQDILALVPTITQLLARRATV